MPERLADQMQELVKLKIRMQDAETMLAGSLVRLRKEVQVAGRTMLPAAYGCSFVHSVSGDPASNSIKVCSMALPLCFLACCC